MNILQIILGFFGMGKKNPIDSINDLFGRSPDAMEAKVELEKSEQQPALQQIELNKIEAKNRGFQGNWRPLLGYVCVLAIFQTYFLVPNVVIFFASRGTVINVPPTNIYDLIMMLTGLLGIVPQRKSS